jgi:hypothetical protein
MRVQAPAVAQSGHAAVGIAHEVGAVTAPEATAVAIHEHVLAPIEHESNLAFGAVPAHLAARRAIDPAY